MKRLLTIILSTCVALGLVLLAVVAWMANRQGVPSDFWDHYKTAHVHFDQHGIPTVDATNWDNLLEAQGYVVASERLWQMDLLRRKAGGRLAEWFGAAAFEHDAEVQAEDRLGIAARSAAALPADERHACDIYARGVNNFIHEQEHRWGIEYLLLRQTPEEWRCSDTLLIVLEMAATLSSQAEREAQQYAWRRNLSPAWQGLLFTLDHPWNKPYFDGPRAVGPVFPPASEYLPKQPIDPSHEARVELQQESVVGSNSWAWRGETGAFLANDPHLGYSVPELWYATRLRVSNDDWVAGVSLPGLPGVVLGMNPHLAWSFTNTGEDVDDYLRVESDEPVVKKTFAIKVKGEAEPRQITALFTQYGPVAKRRYLGEDLYARQWLPLKDGMLRAPAVSMMQAKNLTEFDHAIDGMAAPAQNVIAMDRSGGMLYRMSGTGVRRAVSGRMPAPAAVGAWHGFAPATERRRLFVPSDDGKTRYLASANERLWVDPFGGGWASDDRKDRITAVLASRDNLTRQDMENLQLDTESRFHGLLLHWISEHAGAVEGPAAELVQSWRDWDGTSRSKPRIFTQAEIAENAFVKLLLGRVSRTFAHAEDREVPYRYYLQRAWVTAVLLQEGDQGVAPFGLTSQEVARYLVEKIMAASKTLVLHQDGNRWGGQHPFVGRVPIIGSFFQIEDEPQWGAANLVLAEQPTFGPSVRMVWDLRNPGESTWTLPVGQSGHLFSRHYRDLHAAWQTNERYRVFDDGTTWSLK